MEFTVRFSKRFLANTIILTGFTPIYNEIARRASNFIIDAVSSDSIAVRFMVNHAHNCAKARSIIGRNVILRCLRYGWTFQQFLHVSASVIS